MQQNIEQMENGHIYTRETLPLAAHSRIEEYLRELCLLEGAELPIPQSRIEALLKALITGDYSEIKKPQSRHEGLIYALITGDESHIETCASRIEVLWYMIVKGLSAEELLGTVVNGQLVEDCMSRIESYLWNIAQNGGLGEFVTYQFYEKVKMYNTVARRMKEVKITGDTVVNVVDGDKQLDGGGKSFYELGKFEDKQTYTVINDGSDYTLNGVEYGIGAIETTEDTSTDISVVDIPSGYEVKGFEKFNIQGRTYQNILPDPTLRNSMKNKTMQKFNEGYSNVNVVDGVAKSAILSGQTLVNLANTKSGSIVSSNHTDTKCSYLKNATTYTIFLNLKTINTSKSLIMAQYIGGAVKQNLFLTELSLGLNKKKITTTVELDKLTIFNASSYGGETVEFDELMIIEGDYTSQDVAYFTGMTSSKMPVLSSIGKNLYPYSGLAKTDIAINTWYMLNGQTQTRWGSALHKNCGVGEWFYLNKNTYSLSCSGENVQIVQLVGEGEISYTLGTKELPSGWYSFRVKSNATEPLDIIVNNVQIEINTTTTSYEPYKSNILSTPNDLVLRGIGDIKDTLNVNTREVVERVGEVVLDGSQSGTHLYPNSSDTQTNTIAFKILYDKHAGSWINGIGKCDNLPFVDGGTIYGGDKECVCTDSAGIIVRLLKSKCTDIASFNSYLQSNPLTIQYPLKETVIKTVDLSSSGNWEKIVLDGTQTLSQYNDIGKRYYGVNIPNITPYVNGGRAFANKLLSPNSNMGSNTYSISPANSLNILCFSLDGELSKAEANQYLAQNPITVWYQTTTSQANSIKELLSFSNGHIQLSSDAENSLIPSVDYEVPTSNSYHLDLAKVSTKHTMKNMNGAFTIDGTQYNASANGTFTTPSTMTNKLMVTSAIQSNAMLLEGDVTSKTLPYFKGIKSSFEDKDKIEVLSTGKNLFDYTLYDNTYENRVVQIDGGYRITAWAIPAKQQFNNNLKPNTRYTSSYDFKVVKPSVGATDDGGGKIVLSNKELTKFFLITWTRGQTWSFTTPSDIKDYTRILFYADGGGGSDTGIVEITNIHIEETTSISAHEPYKSNDVKIPLLHPLRSLPNGICDEVVVKGSNATIIKRIADDLTELETPVTTTVDIEITDQDGNVVDELAFFEHGHIMLNSEIPAALNYLPHATSYKGTIYISSVTNKTLYTDDENMMLLYGNQMDKKLPYFKGMNNCQVGNLIISDENSNNVSYDTNIELNRFGTNEDIFDYRTGKLTRHVEVVKLSELTNWQTVTVASQIDTIGFKHTLDVTGMSNQTVNSFNDRMSDLKYDDLYITDKEAIAISGDSLYIRINRSSLNGEDVSALTEYLVAHDITVLFNAVESIEQKEPFDIVAYEGITNAEVKPITGKLLPSKVIISVPTSNREDVDAIYVNQQSINTNQDNLGNTVINQSNDIEVTTTGIMQINEMIGV